MKDKQGLNSPPRLLVIDDDPGISDYIQLVAEEKGFVVGFVDNFNTVGASVKQFDPDIIFLDLCLPGVDGIEILHNLAELKCSSRIYMISGMDKAVLKSASVIGKQYNLDIAGELAKPFSIEEIEEALFQLVDTNSKFTSEEFDAVLRKGRFEFRFNPKLTLDADGTPQLTAVEVNPVWVDDSGNSKQVEEYWQTIEANQLTLIFYEGLIYKAMEICQRWRNKDLNIGLTIPLNGTILSNLKLPNLLHAATERWKIPNATITLVLTEQSLDDYATTMLDILTRLQIKGFKVAIETAGNDDEKLGKLFKLPISELKLHKGYVEKVKNNMDVQFYVSTLISLANKKNYQVCASGVDSAEVLDFLTQSGCNYFQGSHFGPELSETGVLALASLKKRTEDPGYNPMKNYLRAV